MALPRIFLLRASVQTVLCILCFNLGYMIAFYNYSDETPTPKDQTLEVEGAFSRQTLANLRHHKALLFAAIVSSPRNSERRQAIRDTWLNIPRSLRQDVLPAFIIGTQNLSPSEKDIVQQEIDTHKDILALSIEDSFSQLTQKVLSTFQFADKFLNFKYLLKVDDDSFVRLDALLDELKNSNFNDRLYWGFFDGRAPVIRKEGNKWKEDKPYLLCDKYIPYALGGGYVLSRDLVGNM